MTDLRKLIEVVEGGAAKHKDFASCFSGYTLMESLTESYNGSLDAAKALHEALLPGWIYDFTNDGGFVMQSCDNDAEQFQSYGDGPVARHWLIAILHAYEAQQ